MKPVSGNSSKPLQRRTLCQYKPAPLQEQTKNQSKGKDTGVLPDIPDERKTIQAIQGRMEKQNIKTTGY